MKTDNAPCLENGEAFIDFSEFSPPTVPTNYEVIYVLTSGTNFIIEAVNTSTDFTVSSTGRFTVHTLVYNPATLDLGTVELGVTSAFAVNSLLIQGGGDICAALDLAGLPYDIETCTNLLPGGTLFPNPTQNYFRLRTPELYLMQQMDVTIYSANGQVVRTLRIEEPQAEEEFYVGDLPAGVYQLLIEGDQGGYRSARILKL